MANELTNQNFRCLHWAKLEANGIFNEQTLNTNIKETIVLDVMPLNTRHILEMLHGQTVKFTSCNFGLSAFHPFLSNYFPLCPMVTTAHTHMLRVRCSEPPSHPPPHGYIPVNNRNYVKLTLFSNRTLQRYS